MLSNFHTHSSFCDGRNTPEEIVLAAVDAGFDAIGFSGHGYTPFDLRYCMKETDAYIAEVRRLQEKYRSEIEVYLGVEEDAFSPVDRARFDYIIGSSHYFCVNGAYLPIDSSYAYFKECLAAFDYDTVALAEQYYIAFCEYIVQRRPDIIGHFDLVTKFDELDASLFLGDEVYRRIAADALREAAGSGAVFEVNTGAIARNLRTSPYPSEELLHLLKSLDAPIVLSSDSHEIRTLAFAFEETKRYLWDIGFRYCMTMHNGRLEKRNLL